jgi:hypothetical protein
MRSALFSFLLLVALAGCGGATGLIQKDEQGSLAKSTDLYYKLVMWKYYEKAAQFVDPEKFAEYEAFVSANQKDLNITGYEIKEITYVVEEIPPEGGAGSEGSKVPDPDSEKAEADVRVIFTYYKYPSVSEKSVMTVDRWINKGKKWYVTSNPEFQ